MTFTDKQARFRHISHTHTAKTGLLLLKTLLQKSSVNPFPLHKGQIQTPFTSPYTSTRSACNILYVHPLFPETHPPLSLWLLRQGNTPSDKPPTVPL